MPNYRSVEAKARSWSSGCHRRLWKPPNVQTFWTKYISNARFTGYFMCLKTQFTSRTLKSTVTPLIFPTSAWEYSKALQNLSQSHQPNFALLCCLCRTLLQIFQKTIFLHFYLITDTVIFFRAYQNCSILSTLTILSTFIRLEHFSSRRSSKGQKIWILQAAFEWSVHL